MSYDTLRLENHWYIAHTLATRFMGWHLDFSNENVLCWRDREEPGPDASQEEWKEWREKVRYSEARFRSGPSLVRDRMNEFIPTQSLFSASLLLQKMKEQRLLVHQIADSRHVRNGLYTVHLEGSGRVRFASKAYSNSLFPLCEAALFLCVDEGFQGLHEFCHGVELDSWHPGDTGVRCSQFSTGPWIVAWNSCFDKIKAADNSESVSLDPIGWNQLLDREVSFSNFTRKGKMFCFEASGLEKSTQRIYRMICEGEYLNVASLRGYVEVRPSSSLSSRDYCHGC